MLRAAALKLPDHPRIGTAMQQYAPHEVRRLIVGR
jgi:hypothetical protein